MSGIVTARRSVGLLRVTVIGVAGAVLMWPSIAVTLAMTVPEEQPRLVLSLWPAAAIARTAAALELIGRAPTRSRNHPARASEALTLADSALLHEPVLAAAASTVGAASAIGGDQPRAARGYAYAQQMSRRDLQSQLWLIDSAVQRGDVAGALHHYDIALRANPPFVGDTLLPVLARTSAEVAVRRPLIALLRRQPGWRRPYLQEVVAAPLPPAAIAEQLGGLHLAPTEVPILSAGLARLVQARQYRSAVALLPGSSRIRLRNGGFEQEPSLLPFDWWLNNEDDLSAYREPDRSGEGAYVLRIASRERGGPAARQLVALPAGRFILSGIVGNRGAAGGAMPLISVLCDRSRDALAGITPGTLATDGKRRFAFGFTVPDQGCEVQWVTIATAAGTSVDSWLDAMRLQRVATPGG